MSQSMAPYLQKLEQAALGIRVTKVIKVIRVIRVIEVIRIIRVIRVIRVIRGLRDKYALVAFIPPVLSFVTIYLHQAKHTFEQPPSLWQLPKHSLDL